MKKTNYEQGQIPTVVDMNDQHLLTEEAFGKLVEAVTGGLQSVLLSDRPPIVTESGPNWSAQIPEQFAAVDGRFFKVEETQLTIPIKDNKVGIFFILKSVDVAENRERLRLSGSTPVREGFTPVTRKEETSRVAFTESTASDTDPPAPALSGDDVGYVQMATIESSLTGPTSNVIPNWALIWNFPGGGAAVGKHEWQHMPGGNDLLPQAQIGGEQGSSVGLMPPTSLLFAVESLQYLRVASNTPYLTVTENVAQSTLNTPRNMTLEMALHGSLEVKGSGTTAALGVKFATGPYAGQSGVAPNSDHVHPLSQSPITVGYARVDITSVDQLGSVISVPAFGNFSDIYSTEILWGPPNLNTPVPGVECNWVKTSTGFIGVRVIKAAANAVSLEIGREGLTQFQDSVKSWIFTQFTENQQTWNSATGDGNTPNNGVLFLKVIGIR